MYKIIATNELKFIGAQTQMYAAKCRLELYCKPDGWSVFMIITRAEDAEFRFRLCVFLLLSVSRCFCACLARDQFEPGD